MTTFTSTNGAKIESQSICVLYDGATGAIRHAHSATTITGGRQPLQDEIEKDALAYAAQAGLTTSGLEILHVDGSTMSVSGMYQVDLATRTLVMVHTAAELTRRAAPSPVTVGQK